MGNWKLIEAEVTINEVANPSAENTGNFANFNGGTTSRVTTYSLHGIYSYRVQGGADERGGTFTLGSALANAIHYATVKARNLGSAAFQWKLLAGSSMVSPTLLYQIDDDWALYGTEFPAVDSNGSTAIRITQDGATALDANFDGIQVEEKSYYTWYCDGDQEGCEWLNLPHASSSRRLASSRAGGRVRDFKDDYGLGLDTFIGVGFAPQDIAVDEFAILDGGILNNIKAKTRSFTLQGTIIAASDNCELEPRRKALVDVLAPEAVPVTNEGFQPVRILYTGTNIAKVIEVLAEGDGI